MTTRVIPFSPLRTSAGLPVPSALVTSVSTSSSAATSLNIPAEELAQPFPNERSVRVVNKIGTDVYLVFGPSGVAAATTTDILLADGATETFGLSLTDTHFRVLGVASSSGRLSLGVGRSG